MTDGLQILVRDYGWIHGSIGMAGNLLFFIGSIAFLPRFAPYMTMGVWLFILGSLLMLLGALGDLAVKVYEAREQD